MEPQSCSDKEGAVQAVHDTGQSAVPAPNKLTGGSGCNQDGLKNTQESTDKALEGASEQAVEATSTEASYSHSVSPQENTGAGCGANEGALNNICASVECRGENRELMEDCENVSVIPKIVIEQDSTECRESGDSNDDEMDPLITIDDTESQSSDLINFDTVSYDVMRQHGDEEDDDEKSITTLSSLSCDIKLDSPTKQCQGSNSSSLANLLDSSVKETLGSAVNPSAHIGDSVGSASSSCPSSPSLPSSKTTSSAVDGSISEAFMDVRQRTDDEAKIVNCDNNVLSQKDILKVEGEESIVADSSISQQSVDVSSDPNPIEEIIVHLQKDPVAESSGALEVSSPVGENLSLIKPSHSIVAIDTSSPDESKIVMDICDGDHDNSESVIVPDNCEFNSSKDVKAMLSEDVEECLINSSSELKESSGPSAHFLPNENDNLKLNEDENEVICALLSTILVSENPVNVDSQFMNTGLQDSVSLAPCQNVSAKETDVPENISSTANEEIIPCSLEKDDIITATVSSTTEDEVHLPICSHDDAMNVSSVSSTSNENPPCSASVVSSTSANKTEEHISSNTSVINGNISLEVNISSSTASFVSGEDIGVDTFEKISSSMDSQITEENSDGHQAVRTPSPADSALLVSNCVASSNQHTICDSSNVTLELISLEAINGDLSPASETLTVSNVPSGNINVGFEVNEVVSQSTIDCYSENTQPVESPNSGKISKSSSFEDNLKWKMMNHGEQACENVNLSARSSFEKHNEDNTDSSDLPILADLPNESLPIENVDIESKRPTTLLEITSNKASSEKSSGMNFSEFLGLFNSSNMEGMSKPKQYDAAALDEAQQMASSLVDDILKKAMVKAEEKLTSSKSIVGDRVEAVQVANVLVDGVLSEASAHVSSVEVRKAEIATTSDMKDSGGDYSMNSSATYDLLSQVTENNLSIEPCLVSNPESIMNLKNELLDSQENMMNISEDLSAPKTMQSQITSEGFLEENPPSCIAASADMVPNISSDSTSENVNISEYGSLSSLVDVQSKESIETSSSENAGADSSRGSLLTTPDLRLHSEASLFVDGVLQEAVKKYEESSSSDSSPAKIRSLALDSEFFQEEEELATPCGEMLTEHFMDFESGRNVSVFCSIPENRNEDQILAYDRVAHTIGNREVDSDTGKSVSVFRIEEDVFYEIQRASTCTSVFESVEEEDEDMIDTTVPVEERPEKSLSTSASFPSYDKDKFGASDDLFSADCDAFEDAVGAFLTKERLAHNEMRNRKSKDKPICHGETQQESEVTCRALVLRHPEIGISNSDEKKRMAEKWANGGESEVPDTPEMREKQRAIREALDSDNDVAVKLCRLALTEGGLINDALRREAWPRMLGLDPTLEVDAPSLEDLKSHPEYEQVVLDVNRSLKRFPPDIPKDQRETLQDKLTRLIMYVISKHPHLRYYQGYHDVAVTFLLVVGESIAFQIMERLSTEHLSDCMQPTMERTSYLLHFIYPLLHRLHPTLADYLERSEVGTMFCLPWFLTWFGHSLDHYKDVVRLYDHFLASPPLAPLYVAAVLVAHRADEVLAVDCDMAAIHALLSHIPDSLPLEILLRDATDLYMKFPPESIEREVEERFRNEQDMRAQEMEARERVQRQRALRRRRGQSHGSGSWQLAEIQDRIGGSMMVLNRWMPPWVVQQQRLSMRLLFASATFFVGFYVYSRGGDMLPYP